VPADWSGATVLLSAAAFLRRPVVVRDIQLRSAHPDRQYLDVLRRLGFEVREEALGVSAAGVPRSGGAFDLSGFPDSAPALAALATLAPVPVQILGVKHLRHKESDRIAALAEVLGAAGASIRAEPDGLIVAGRWTPDPSAEPVLVSTRGDHRMAMAAALIGLARPLLLDDARCVTKSFPGFFEQWPGATEIGGEHP
jgi:3-phosphoshikimate 1-carboxyvinyltransferase